MTALLSFGLLSLEAYGLPPRLSSEPAAPPPTKARRGSDSAPIPTAYGPNVAGEYRHRGREKRSSSRHHSSSSSRPPSSFSFRLPPRLSSEPATPPPTKARRGSDSAPIPTAYGSSSSSRPPSCYSLRFVPPPSNPPSRYLSEPFNVLLFFSLLQNERNPDHQFVINWCNDLVRVFEDPAYERNIITPIFIARSITLLGQKARNARFIKSTLQSYFQEKPWLMKYWIEVAKYFLRSPNSREQFNQQQLSNIFYGHAQLGLPPDAEFLKAWNRAVLDHLNSKDPQKQFDQQALSNIFYGHALLGRAPDADFFQAWKAAAMACLRSTNPREQFDQQELSNIFYGHALLERQPDDEFFQAWKTAALARLRSPNPRDQFNQQALSNIFYGHALLGRAPDADFFQAWRAAALARLRSTTPRDQFNQQHLSNIFYGYALLGIQPDNDMFQAWKSAAMGYLRSTDSRDQFSLKHMHAIYLAISRFSLEEEFDQVLFDSMKKQHKTKRPRSSFLQEDVSAVLSRVLITQCIEREPWFDAIASRVDMCVSSISLIIEVDGPFHFFPGTRQYKPKNRLKDDVLTSKGFRVVRIPCFEWEALKSEGKEDYVRTKMAPFLERKTPSFDPLEETTSSPADRLLRPLRGTAAADREEETPVPLARLAA